MKISLCQMDIAWEDAEENLRRAYDAVSRTDADLIVLPEMFASGFSSRPERVAEPMDGKAAGWLSDTALKTGKAIVASLAVEDGGGYYNRAFFVHPDGSIETCDKRHLFSMAGEDHSYTAGCERLIVEYKGWRIMPLVCYDLRFPVWSRNNDEYDLLVYVASWPACRKHAWNTLLRARAIENLAYVAGVNRVGSDPTETYDGDSVVLDFRGMELAAGKQGKEEIVTADLDLDALRKFREDFPTFRDADKFSIEI